MKKQITIIVVMMLCINISANVTAAANPPQSWWSSWWSTSSKPAIDYGTYYDNQTSFPATQEQPEQPVLKENTPALQSEQTWSEWAKDQAIDAAKNAVINYALDTGLGLSKQYLHQDVHETAVNTVDFYGKATTAATISKIVTPTLVNWLPAGVGAYLTTAVTALTSVTMPWLIGGAVALATTYQVAKKSYAWMTGSTQKVAFEIITKQQPTDSEFIKTVRRKYGQSHNDYTAFLQGSQMLMNSQDTLVQNYATLYEKVMKAAKINAKYKALLASLNTEQIIAHIKRIKQQQQALASLIAHSDADFGMIQELAQRVITSQQKPYSVDAQVLATKIQALYKNMNEVVQDQSNNNAIPAIQQNMIWLQKFLEKAEKEFAGI